MSVFKLRHKPTLLVGGAALLASLCGAVVTAVHHVPQAGPFIANSLRSVIGINAVANLEELVASVEDTSMRVRWWGERPRSLSSVSRAVTRSDVLAPVLQCTDTSLSPTAPDIASDASIPVSMDRSAEASRGDSIDRALREPLAQGFTPAPIPPPYLEVAAEGDGTWLPVPDPEHPERPALLFKTLLHPDPERPWSELFLVAMPSSLVRLAAVPGTAEPSTDNPAAEALPHRGLIPESQHGELLAAFNGGFRAEHGHHGMLVDGVLLVPPRADMCTVASYDDGSLRIGTYARITAQAPKPLWFRQSPRCMVEQGALHPGLRDANARGWGSTLEGDTVIRRSSIALSEDGGVLYVAVTNFTTARALAVGMRAAGGWNVAQLDVNFSFPKFLLFPRDESGTRRAASLFEGFLFEAEEMLEEPTERDFFYVVRRQRDERTEAPSLLAKQSG